MTLAERINAMPPVTRTSVRDGGSVTRTEVRAPVVEEAPSLRSSPFTLLEPQGGLSRDECDHLAFCERHDFKAHEKEIAACIAEYRRLRRAGDLLAPQQLARAKHIIDHLLEV